MKPQFTFYFADEPQYAATDSREYTASLMRGARKHPDRYELRRVSLHCYTLRLTYPHSPVAIVRAP